VVQKERCEPLSLPEFLDLALVLLGVDRRCRPTEKRGGPPALVGCVCAVCATSIGDGS